MARCMRFDEQDKRALRALDSDFTISTDGETATVAGEMEIEIVRLAHDGGDRTLADNHAARRRGICGESVPFRPAGSGRHRSGRRSLMADAR